jgi:hypothetical protein
MRAGLAAGLLGAFLVVGCDDGGGSCGKVQPCGGDLTGVWQYEAYCGALADLALPAQVCQIQTIVSISSSWSGTLTFGADGSFEDSTARAVTFTLDMPSFCLPDGVDCRGFGETFASTHAFAIDSMSCVPTPSGCRCLQKASVSTDSAGTATTAGTALTLMPSGQRSSTLSYCVQGDELHISETQTPASGVPELIIAFVLGRK